MLGIEHGFSRGAAPPSPQPSPFSVLGGDQEMALVSPFMNPLHITEILSMMSYLFMFNYNYFWPTLTSIIITLAILVIP